MDMEEDMEFYVIVDKNGLYYAKNQRYEYTYTSDIHKAKFYSKSIGTFPVIDHANTYQRKDKGNEHIPLSFKKVRMTVTLVDD
jgi:hypothetical protein